MYYLIQLLIVLILIYISYEDLTSRKLDVRVAGFLFILSLSYHYFFIGYWISFLLNMLFIGILVVGLFFYFSIKGEEMSEIFKLKIGIGDILFMIAVSPLFYNQQYILYIISGMIFCILQHAIIQLIKKEKDIPMAGYLSNYLIILLLLPYFGFASLIF